MQNLCWGTRFGTTSDRAASEDGHEMKLKVCLCSAVRNDSCEVCWDHFLLS